MIPQLKQMLHVGNWRLNRSLIIVLKKAFALGSRPLSAKIQTHHTDGGCALGVILRVYFHRTSSVCSFLEFSLIPTSESEAPVWAGRERPRGLPEFIIRKMETWPNPRRGNPFPGNFF